MLVIYEVMLIFMVGLEYRYYRSYITPFTIIGSIYILVPLLLKAIGKQIHMYEISDFNLLCTLIYLLILWSSNLIWIFQQKKQKYYKEYNINRYEIKIDMFEKIIFIFFLVCVIAFVSNAFHVVRVYGIANTKNHTNGLTAHMGYMALMMAPYITYTGLTKKKIVYIGSVGILGITLLVLQNKLPIIILLLQCTYFILCVKGRVKGKGIIKKAIIIAVVVVLLFILLYSVRPWLMGENTSLKSALEHGIERCIHYFFSGFISSNEYYQNPCGNKNGMRVAFGFFDTLFQAISGNRNYIDPVITKWVLIAPGSGTNVGGLFSELVYQIGYINAGIYVWLVGTMIYMFYNLTCKWQIFVNTTCYLIAVLSISFFCNFFSLFATIEKLCYVFLLDVLIVYFKIFKVRIKIK